MSLNMLEEYTPTNWTNDSGESINADNLSKIENGISAAVEGVNGCIKNLLKVEMGSYTGNGENTFVLTFTEALPNILILQRQSVGSDNSISIITKGVNSAHCFPCWGASSDSTASLNVEWNSADNSIELSFTPKLNCSTNPFNYSGTNYYWTNIYK